MSFAGLLLGFASADRTRRRVNECPTARARRDTHCVDVYVESGVGGHVDDAVRTWVFDLPWWGVCGQGIDETGALRRS
jgi:hypothetical protein